MATTGTVSVKVTDYDSLIFKWNQISQDAAKSTTTIGWSLQLKATQYGAIVSSVLKNWNVTINGTKYTGSSSVAIDNWETKNLAQGTTTIAHNADGTKTFSFGFSQQFDITFNGVSIGTIQGGGSGKLEPITRAATLSCVGGAIEDTTRIFINRYYSSQKVSIMYWFAGEEEEGTTAYIVQNDTSSSFIDWVIPDSFYDRMVNLSKATCKLICISTSVSGSLSSEIEIPIRVNGDIASPIITSISIKDINVATSTTTGNADLYFVKGVSNAEIAIAIDYRKKATSKKVKVTCGSKAVNSFYDIMYGVDGDVFNIEVTDSRGYTTTAYKEIILHDYIPLTANVTIPLPVIEDNSTAASTSIQISGNCYNGWYGNQKAQNTVRMRYRIKENDGAYGAYSDYLPATISGNTYSINIPITGLHYESGYRFQMDIVDLVSAISNVEEYVKATPVFDWGANDFNFNVPVTIQGNALLDYVIEEGTEAMGSNGTWYWRKWKSGKADCYGVRNFGNMGVSTVQGSLYSSESFTQSFPSGLFNAAPAYLSIDPFGSSTAGRMYFIAKGTRPTASTTNSFYVMSPTSATISAVYITFYAVGAWK